VHCRFEKERALARWAFFDLCPSLYGSGIDRNRAGSRSHGVEFKTESRKQPKNLKFLFPLNEFYFAEDSGACKQKKLAVFENKRWAESVTFSFSRIRG